jgi:hypothetical protein
MRTLAFAVLALLLAPASAEACWGPGSAYLHKVLPGWIPADAIVAEVEFDMEYFNLRPNFETNLRGRVRRMIQGSYSGATLLVRMNSLTCDSPFANGRSGFLIGTPDGMDDGELIVVPITASPPFFELPETPRRSGPPPPMLQRTIKLK